LPAKQFAPFAANAVASPAVNPEAVPVIFVPTSTDGVPSHDAPEIVRAVVLAPPFIEKRPLVIVEEALEIKPKVSVCNKDQMLARVVLGIVVEAVIQ